MAQTHLWKFPKDFLPDLKKEYLAENWLFLINKFNYYMVGETLCPVCPGSVDKIKEYLKPIFLADIEVLNFEGREAGKQELIELFAKYVTPTADPTVVQRLPEKYLKGVVCTFANADLKARGVSEKRRYRLFTKVMRVSFNTFHSRYCDKCLEAAATQ